MSEAARALPIGRLLYYLREALGEALQNVLRTARGNQSYPPRDENFKVTELIDDLQRCHTAILILCDLFIVSPERPLCKEIVDLCRKHNITSRFNVLAANSGPVVTNTPPQVIESWRRSLEALWLGEVRDRVNYYGKKGLSVKDTMSMFLRWKATTHITVEKVVHRILQEYCALSDGEDVLRALPRTESSSLISGSQTGTRTPPRTLASSADSISGVPPPSYESTIS